MTVIECHIIVTVIDKWLPHDNNWNCNRNWPFVIEPRPNQSSTEATYQQRGRQGLLSSRNLSSHSTTANVQSIQRLHCFQLGCISRAVGDHLAEHQLATVLSILDHNVAYSKSPHFHDNTSLHFTQHYTMPKKLGSNPTPRKKAVMVTVHPYCHPDTNSPCMWDMFFVVMKDDPAFKKIFYLLMLIQLLHYCIL